MLINNNITPFVRFTGILLLISWYKSILSNGMEVITLMLFTLNPLTSNISYIQSLLNVIVIIMQISVILYLLVKGKWLAAFFESQLQQRNPLHQGEASAFLLVKSLGLLLLLKAAVQFLTFLIDMAVFFAYAMILGLEKTKELIVTIYSVDSLHRQNIFWALGFFSWFVLVLTGWYLLVKGGLLYKVLLFDQKTRDSHPISVSDNLK